MIGWKSIALRAQRTLCIALLAVLGFSISCDRNCPTAPPPPEDKGYNFYVLVQDAGPTWNEAKVFVYNTKELGLVDSIPLGALASTYRYNEIEVAPDESYLMLSAQGQPPHHQVIIDLDSRQPIWQQSGTPASIEVSPNGKCVVVEGYTLTWCLDGKTFDTLAIDTAAGKRGAWDSAGNVYYSLSFRSGKSYIRRFSLQGMSWMPEIPVNTSVGADLLQTTSNPNKVFLLSYYGFNNSRVVSYYLADSSVGFDYRLTSALTEFAITPDCKTVLFSDPIDYVNFGKKNIYMVNTFTDHLETIIPPPPFGAISLNPSGIAVSPDNRYAMVASTSLSLSTGLISLTDRKYVAFFNPDSSHIGQPIGVACRAQPY
jgi:hypothetical protein